MRIFYITCSIIASVTNILLILLFFVHLRTWLVGKAWICIIIAFNLVLINNLIISYLVLDRPKLAIAAFLIATFFFNKAVKNCLWLIGFWIQCKEFSRLEDLDSYLVHYRKNKEIKLKEKS